MSQADALAGLVVIALGAAIAVGAVRDCSSDARVKLIVTIVGAVIFVACITPPLLLVWIKAVFG